MKTIQQLSVFLENKFGRLNEVLGLLGESHIRIVAAMVADTTEYGILRMITSDTARAVKVLRGAGVSANISEVIAVHCGSEAGSFAHDLGKLAEEGVSIEYMYCFSHNGDAVLVLRPNDQQKALAAITKHALRLLPDGALSTL